MQRSGLVPGQVEAIVFDVIGTLVDEDATWARLAERLADAAAVAGAAELHSSWAELLGSKMDAVVAGDTPWRPHRLLVSDSARESVARAGGQPTAAAMNLVASVDDDYAAWPEVPAATAALRQDRLVAGVSNGDLDALARLANTNGISWDIALSTGTVGTFKPAPAAYRYAIDALRLDPARTLFVAAHPWDLRAAAGHGFRTAYVARPGAERPAADDQFDLTVADLSALVEFFAGQSAERT